MRKRKFLISASLFIVFFSLIGTTKIKAASGDFYNITKQVKYSRTNILSDKNLLKQLESEEIKGHILAKELSSGKIINLELANNLFAQLLRSMDVQQALISAINNQNVIIDRTATGIDKFPEAGIESDFDIVIIE